MFNTTNIKSLNENMISMISDEWMLISAGDKKKSNMMTASWGFLGEMWGKDCAVCAIRPQRYTFEIIENCDYYALSFLGDNKDVHKISGHSSGRDTDKIKATGLTPIFSDGTVYFEEARLVLICRKMYSDFLKPECFKDKTLLSKWYHNDLHKLYFGEIVKVLVKE